METINQVDARLCKDGYIEFYYVEDGQVISDFDCNLWNDQLKNHYLEKGWFTNDLIIKCNSLASIGCHFGEVVTV